MSATVIFEDGPWWVDVYMIHQPNRTDRKCEDVYALRAALAGPMAPESFVGKPMGERRRLARHALERSVEATRKVIDAGVHDERYGFMRYPDSAYTPDVAEVQENGGLMCATVLGQTPPIGWSR